MLGADAIRALFQGGGDEDVQLGAFMIAALVSSVAPDVKSEDPGDE